MQELTEAAAYGSQRLRYNLLGIWLTFVGCANIDLRRSLTPVNKTLHALEVSDCTVLTAHCTHCSLLTALRLRGARSYADCRCSAAVHNCKISI